MRRLAIVAVIFMAGCMTTREMAYYYVRSDNELPHVETPKSLQLRLREVANERERECQWLRNQLTYLVTLEYVDKEIFEAAAQLEYAYQTDSHEFLRTCTSYLETSWGILFRKAQESLQ